MPRVKFRKVLWPEHPISWERCPRKDRSDPEWMLGFDCDGCGQCESTPLHRCHLTGAVLPCWNYPDNESFERDFLGGER